MPVPTWTRSRTSGYEFSLVINLSNAMLHVYVDLSWKMSWTRWLLIVMVEWTDFGTVDSVTMVKAELNAPSGAVKIENAWWHNFPWPKNRLHISSLIVLHTKKSTCFMFVLFHIRIDWVEMTKVILVHKKIAEWCHLWNRRYYIRLRQTLKNECRFSERISQLCYEKAFFMIWKHFMWLPPELILTSGVRAVYISL